MRIADVRARVLAARSDAGVSFSLGHYDTYCCVLVEVTTDEGLVGYGEAIARRGPQMAKAAVESLLASVLIGEDPRNIEGLWTMMMDRLRRWGHARGVVVEAISGVDTALWDLIGRAEDKPVWQLLHGAGRSSVPCYASSIYMSDGGTMRAQAREQVAAGFPSIKIKIGRGPEQGGVRGDVDSVLEVREEVGPDVELYVDANGAYDAATAILVARGLERADVRFFEEPVPPDDLDGYARLHSMTSVPLAAGETEFGVFGFRDLIERGLIDVVQPDVARCGGITAARHICTLTYAHNLTLAPHTGFSGGISQLAALHVAAASPVLKSVEYMFIDNPLREIFIGGFPTASAGVVAVPDGPGLGLELDQGLVDEMAEAADAEVRG